MSTNASVSTTTRKARSFTRFNRLLLAGIVAATAALSLTQVAQAGPPPPVVPSGIEVPDGNKVFLVGHAVGVQIYSCNAAGGGSCGVSSRPGRICTTTRASSSSPTSAGQRGGPWTAAGSWVGSTPRPSPSIPQPFHGCGWPLLRRPLALTATGSCPRPTSNGSQPPVASLLPPPNATRQRQVPWPRSHTRPTTTSGREPVRDATPVPGRGGRTRQPEPTTTGGATPATKRPQPAAGRPGPPRSCRRLRCTTD